MTMAMYLTELLRHFLQCLARFNLSNADYSQCHSEHPLPLTCAKKTTSCNQNHQNQEDDLQSKPPNHYNSHIVIKIIKDANVVL